MSLSERLQKREYQEIWNQYCGFLDLNIEEYMKIQNRLMEEQIQLFSSCEPWFIDSEGEKTADDRRVSQDGPADNV